MATLPMSAYFGRMVNYEPRQPHGLGDAFLKDTLKVPEATLASPTFDLLAHLGFTRKQVEEASTYVCGTMTIEGAPHLKPEHYPVFDCVATTLTISR